ncbi:Gfo/Idh/MocA family oxidoreductase [Chloroflexus sp.]|uniref:Gfo/Idh/MocA family protein n=1 Tax=Chloroflexus sp. TaxID=1904827 RepID=UPI00298F3B4D|nr:Gfo/Idh/MocA family oxidoreductase [Chloroflexus sp.]MDW8403890.1 Gfo/Idh/MocA family oxidoreductase [Chloroflexus sp.]
MTKISVIGCGHWGKNLVRNFHQLGVLHAVCDVTEAGRATAAATAPGTAIVADVTRALRDPEPRGIVIATPAETHFELAKQALQAGKDVFVEKPLALSLEQGAALVRLADQRRRILMVGHVLEYHPGILALRRLVEQGDLGKVQYIYSNRLSLGKVRREENILWSFAPHDIAVILRLLGSMPFAVTACGGAYIQPNIADVTVTHLLFDNGVRAHIHVSWLHPFKEQRLVVIGSRKMASFDDVHKRLVVYDQRVEWQEGQPIPVRDAGIDVPYPADEPLRLECEAFLAAIQTRRPPLTDGRSGLRVLRVLQAAQQSLVTNGQPVHLPIAALAPSADHIA